MPTWEGESPHSAEELLRNLRANVDPLPTVALGRVPGSAPFLGLVWNQSFEIRRREALGKNDFGAIFRGTVRAQGTGSVISGAIGPQSALRALLYIFLTIGICAFLGGAAIAFWSSDPGRLVGLYIGTAFLFGPPAICGLLILPSIADRSRLIREVERILNIRLRPV